MMVEGVTTDIDSATLEEWRQQLQDKVLAINDQIVQMQSEFEERVTPLRHEQERVTQLVAHVQGLLDLLDHKTPGAGMPRHANSPKDLPDIAYRVLKDLGSEMYYRDLALRIEELGYEIRGSDPGTYLLAYIGKDARFVKVRRGTYALAEWRPKRAAGKKKTGRTRAAARRK